MDSTLFAGLIGAIATLTAGAFPLIQNQIRKKRGILRGTIDQLIVPLKESHAAEQFKELLPKATNVRMCGWSLSGVIGENRHQLRKLVKSENEIRILLLDPSSCAVNVLDSVLTHTEPKERKSQKWPPVISNSIAKNDTLRAIEILRDNDIIRRGPQSNNALHLCKALLPYGLLLVECEDGSNWLSVQIYPLHPDIRIGERLTFTLRNDKTELWRSLKAQFDAAWEDPNFSQALCE